MFHTRIAFGYFPLLESWVHGFALLVFPLGIGFETMDRAVELRGSDVGSGSSLAHASFVSLDNLDRQTFFQGEEGGFRRQNKPSSSPRFHFFWGHVNPGKHLKSLLPLSNLQDGGKS